MHHLLQRSETLRCIDSMRQISAALHSYRGDHDGWMPPGYPSGAGGYDVPPDGAKTGGTLHTYLVGYLTDLRYKTDTSAAIGELPFCPGGMGGAARVLDNAERSRRVKGSYGANSYFGLAKFDEFPYQKMTFGAESVRGVGPSVDKFDPSRFPFLLEIRADGGNLDTWSFTHQNQALNGSFGETGEGWGAISPGRSHGYGDALNFVMMAGNVETVPRNDFRNIPSMDKSWQVSASVPLAKFAISGEVPANIPGRSEGEKIFFSHGGGSYGQHKSMYPQFSTFDQPE
jgi:hypothetical protein